MSNNNSSVKKLVGNRTFIALMVLMVVIITVTAIKNRTTKTAVLDVPPAETEQVQVSAPVKETVSQVKDKTPATPVEEQPAEPESVSYKLPLQGQLQKGYSKDSLVWDETMQDWRTHCAIDIASTAGDEVDTCAPGMVIEAVADQMHGYTVKVDHGDGVVTVYKNLAKTVVEKGDVLDEGQMIGTVGDTAPFELAQKAHLHLEATRDGDYINPLDLFENKE